MSEEQQQLTPEEYRAIVRNEQAQIHAELKRVATLVEVPMHERMRLEWQLALTIGYLQACENILGPVPTPEPPSDAVPDTAEG